MKIMLIKEQHIFWYQIISRITVNEFMLSKDPLYIFGHYCYIKQGSTVPSMIVIF